MELGATLCGPQGIPACESCPVRPWCAAREVEDSWPGDPHAPGRIRVTDYPTKVEKKKPREERVATLVVEAIGGGGQEEDGKGIREEEQGWMTTRMETTATPSFVRSGSVLLVQRPPTGLLAGLWEFPSVSVDGLDLDRTSSSHHMAEYAAVARYASGRGDFTLSGVLGENESRYMGDVVHVFSHIRMTLAVYYCQVARADLFLSENKSYYGGGGGGGGGDQDCRWLPAADIEAGAAVSTSVLKVRSLAYQQRGMADPMYQGRKKKASTGQTRGPWGSTGSTKKRRVEPGTRGGAQDLRSLWMKGKKEEQQQQEQQQRRRPDLGPGANPTVVVEISEGGDEPAPERPPSPPREEDI